MSEISNCWSQLQVINDNFSESCHLIESYSMFYNFQTMKAKNLILLC